MKRLLMLVGALLPVPAIAQTADPHAGHHMPGMDMSGMEMPSSEASLGEAEPQGTDQPPGSAKAPVAAHDRAADRYYDPAAMAAAEKVMMAPPLSRYSQLLLDTAEYQFRNGRDGYRWEGEAWVGDLNRFVVKSEGEGTFGEGVETAEIQALYAHALDPWWNAQVGIRQDLGAGRRRTWATLALDGRARYQFDAGAALFLSDKGQLAGRIAGSYDQRITQRLVLQPRIELNLAAQDIPENRVGSGLSSAELGLRLRYEIARAFAPYLGFNWSRTTGRTARYAREDGKDRTEQGVVAGVRFWF